MNPSAAGRLIKTGLLSGTITVRNLGVEAASAEAGNLKVVNRQAQEMDAEENRLIVAQRAAMRAEREKASEDSVSFGANIELTSSTEALSAAVSDPANADLFDEENSSKIEFERVR
jgi:flagellar basal body rod protein FlgF